MFSVILLGNLGSKRFLVFDIGLDVDRVIECKCYLERWEKFGQKCKENVLPH